MDAQTKAKVRKFCRSQSRKGRWATAPHRLGPAIAEKFKLSLREGCKLAMAWTLYEL